MKFFHAVNNFTSGEWSPKMHARTDTQQYVTAADELKNAIVQIQGGAFRRPGTTYLAVTVAQQLALDTALQIRTIPFIYSDKRYMVVAMDGALSSWFVVDHTGATVNLVDLSGSPFTGSVLLAQEVKELQYVQIGNTLVITTGKVPPIVIVPNSAAAGLVRYSWCVKENLLGYVAYAQHFGVKKWEAVPYGPFESSRTKGTVTVAGSTTVGSSVTLTFSYDEFGSVAATFVFPRYIRLTAAAKTFVVEIGATTSSTGATGTVVYNPDAVAAGTFGTAAGTFWEISQWGPSKETIPADEGFPKCVASFEQRLYFGRTSNYPETFWGSFIGNIIFFMRAPYAQDSTFSTYSSDNSYPWSATLVSNKSSKIVGMTGAKSLVLNTDSSEAVAYTSNGSALGALNVSIDTSTSFGSEAVQPYRVNNFLTFVQKTGRKIRDLVFSFEQDQYKSSDLGFVADHLTMGEEQIDPIVELAKTEDPSSILFARTNSGVLLSATLDRDYQINAWAKHELGGTLAKVKAFCSLAKVNIGDGVEHEYLFMIVERTVDGNTVRYLERMNQIYEVAVTDTNFPPIYLDSIGVGTFGGLSSPIVDNLDHLEGEEVDVVADGNYVGRHTVSGGQVTIDRSYTFAHAGLPYETVIAPLPIEAGTQLGTSIGIAKRVDELTIRLWNSYGCMYGKPEDMIELDFRDPTAPTGDPVVLVTDDKRVQFPAGYDRKAKVVIVQRKPWPCNVLAVVTRGVTYD